MVALIADSAALSQIPSEAARPWTLGQCPAYAGTNLYCLVTEATG